MPLLPRAWPVTSGGRLGIQNSTCSLKSPKLCLVRMSPPSTSAEPPETGQVAAAPLVCSQCAQVVPSNSVIRLVPAAVRLELVDAGWRRPRSPRCAAGCRRRSCRAWASSTLPDCGLRIEPLACGCQTCAAAAVAGPQLHLGAVDGAAVVDVEALAQRPVGVADPAPLLRGECRCRSTAGSSCRRRCRRCSTSTHLPPMPASVPVPLPRCAAGAVRLELVDPGRGVARWPAW